MKILIIAAADLPIPAYKGGATETLITELLKLDIIKNDYEISVYSHCAGENFVDGKIRYYYLHQTWYEKVYFYANLILRIMSGRKRHIPDIFPWQIAKYECLADYDLILLEGNKDQVIPIRKIFKGTLVLHIHTVMTLMKNTYKAKEIVEKCDYIIANSSFAKIKIGEIEGSKEEKILEWKNCIDTKRYLNNTCDKANLRKDYGIDENEFVCIFCGRLEEGKGVLELIKAYKMANIPGKLMIVGASWFGSSTVTDYIGKLQVEAESIKSKILFTGYVKHEEIHKYYKMSDIAIMPSIYEESAGLVALEAQASGLPTIVSNIGGLPEYVSKESQLKVNVDEDFVRNISDRICQLYYEKNFYKKEQQLALSNIIDYDMQIYGVGFLDITNQIIAKEKG